MAYNHQTFSVDQIHTAAQVQQTEDNTRDHIHGVDSVVPAGFGFTKEDKTAEYNVLVGDYGKMFSCVGSFDITLTAAATLGAGFGFAVSNVGSEDISVNPDGAELLDGAATSGKIGTQRSALFFTPDGVQWTSIGLKGGLKSTQEKTSSGAYIRPSGISGILVALVGGGGGGGGGDDTGSGRGGGGGGGGGWAQELIDVSAVTSIGVTIGGGGAGGAANTNGTGGSTTSFGAYLSATGGSGGVRGTTNPPNGGAGGNGTGDMSGTGHQGSGGIPDAGAAGGATYLGGIGGGGRGGKVAGVAVAGVAGQVIVLEFG